MLVPRCIVSNFWNSSVRLHRTNVGLTTLEVNQSSYRIIISDYRMPAMNGIEMLSRIKEINPTIVRVIMSAFEIEDKIFEQFNCVDKFLQKPN